MRWLVWAAVGFGAWYLLKSKKTEASAASKLEEVEALVNQFGQVAGRPWTVSILPNGMVQAVGKDGRTSQWASLDIALQGMRSYKAFPMDIPAPQ